MKCLLATSHDFTVLDESLDLICNSLREVMENRVRIELVVEFLI